MSEFKLKVSIGNANIELEGEGELVCKFFQELRENGLGELAKTSIMNTLENGNTTSENPIATQFSTDVNKDSTNYPTLNDIALSDKIKGEQNWVLIYALYASEFGAQSVTKKAIRQMYATTKRATSTRSKNLSTNMKKLVSNQFLSALNNTNFIITDNGKAHAKALLGV